MPPASAFPAPVSSTCLMRSAKKPIRPELYGILGFPLTSTHSPVIHNAAFRACGLPHHYGTFRVSPRDLSSGVRALRDLGVQGFNVTIPHKINIIPHMTSLSTDARAVGAVNTVKRTAGGWRGFNTDIGGFVDPLTRYRRSLRGKSAVMFGCGGAARAVAFALFHELHIGALLIVARSPSRARAFVEWSGEVAGSIPVTVESLGRPANWLPAFGQAGIVVNATPIGMVSTGARKLLPPSAKFKKGQIAYDLVYGRITDFMARANRSKAVAIDGSAMLLGQAAQAFQLWTGKSFPRRAVESELEE